jgi:E3 ubiquitin-protein ligase HERC3
MKMSRSIERRMFRAGQLGVGDTDSRLWPTNVKSLQHQKVTYAACGEKHSTVLTLEGGIFSFGSGVHGQLGHNSTNDELLPRKITELMGTEVTQIACGRFEQRYVSLIVHADVVKIVHDGFSSTHQ